MKKVVSSISTSVPVIDECLRNQWPMILEAAQCPSCLAVFARDIHNIEKDLVCHCPECCVELEYPCSEGDAPLEIKTEKTE